ncbi:ribokinase [Flammeovirgaceae bacterium SG7u.111]|nr:ribokinase [Flammeovirgaceae bacterium SG7u.132]WPO38364.1 ribokinase [Flammeovirgaceae bacterium SG7u.111]
MSEKIVVIGSSNVDMIMKMDRLPKRGETVTDADFMQVFGGKGANQAVSAARAGGNVVFVNCVGDDAFAPVMVKNFEKDGMDTRYVFKETGVASGTALIMIGDAGDNCISVAPGANYRLTPAYIDQIKDEIAAAEIVVMQYEILEETITYVLDYCRKIGKPTLLNFAPARAFDLSYFKGLTYLVVNESETEFLCGINPDGDENTEKAAKALQQLGPEKVIITLGVGGSYILDGDKAIRVSAFDVEAVDTTAAGDVYCGSLAVAIVEGKSLKEAVKFASAASALAITKMGAQPSAHKRTEIDAFLKERG